MFSYEIDQRAYRFRISPTSEQCQVLAQIFGCCRWAYNLVLVRKTTAYREAGQHLPYGDLSALLPIWKTREETAWLGEVLSVPLEPRLRHLDGALVNFFEGRERIRSSRKNTTTRRLRSDGVSGGSPIPLRWEAYCQNQSCFRGKRPAEGIESQDTIEQPLTPSGRFRCKRPVQSFGSLRQRRARSYSSWPRGNYWWERALECVADYKQGLEAVEAEVDC